MPGAASAVARPRLLMAFGSLAAVGPLWLLAGYFTLIATGRVLLFGSAELDESEQVVLTQFWQRGYVSQPPLYTWIQALIFSVMGTSVAALAVLKGGLLFSTCAGVYFSVKIAAGGVRPALAAMASLFFVPQFLWESQRDLTHSVMVSTAAAVTLLVFLKMLQTRSPVYYCGFGLCAGLGILSKYNYVLLLVPLLLAACSLREPRRALYNRWVWASVAIMVGVISPHLAWVGTHWATAISHAPQMLAPSTSSALTSSWGCALKLVEAVAAFVGPLLALYVVLFGRALPTEGQSREASEVQALIKRTLIIGLLLCLAVAPVLLVRFKDRWLQPLLLLTPVYLALLVQPRLDALRFRRLIRCSFVFGIGAMLTLALIPLLASVTQRPTRLNAPFAALGQQLAARGGVHPVIVADSFLTGGNLKLLTQTSVVVVPEGPAFPIPTNTPWLVVWDATALDDPSPDLQRLLTKLRPQGIEMPKPSFVEAPYNFFPAKRMKLGYSVIMP